MIKLARHSSKSKLVFWWRSVRATVFNILSTLFVFMVAVLLSAGIIGSISLVESYIKDGTVCWPIITCKK